MSIPGVQYKGLVDSFIIFNGYFIVTPLIKPIVSLNASEILRLVVSKIGSLGSFFTKHSSQTRAFSVFDHHSINLRLELHKSQNPLPQQLQ